MKRVLVLLVLLFGLVVQVQAQTSGQFALTSSTTAGAPVPEIGTGVNLHQITWYVTGTVSTCAVKLQQSVDAITWSDLIAAQTCTSNGGPYPTGLQAGVANYVRINATTFTGTGTLTVRYNGYVQYPFVGNGGTGAATDVAYFCAGGLSLCGDSSLTYTPNGGPLTTTGQIIGKYFTASHIGIGAGNGFNFDSTASGYGMFYNGGTALRFQGGTANAFSVSGANSQVRSDGSFAFSSTTDSAGTPDVTLFRDAANTLAQRNGVNAQILREYNTTDGAGNAEWANLGYTSNRFLIRSTASGTGTARNLALQSDSGAGIDIISNGVTAWHFSASSSEFYPDSDNASAIGDHTHRVSSANIIALNDVGSINATNGSNIAVNNSFLMADTQSYAWNSRGAIKAQADGVLTIWNNANTDFGRLQFGGTTNSFPSIKRNNAAIDIRLADDSGYANVNVGGITVNGAASTGNMNINGTFYWQGFPSLSTALSGAVCMSSTNQVEVNTNAGGCLVSSERFKDNILAMTHGYDWLSQMQPVTWTWKDASLKQPKMGAGTAEAMAAIDPSLATFDDEGRPYSLNDRGILGVTINAIKEEYALIESLQREIADLKRRLN